MPPESIPEFGMGYSHDAVAKFYQHDATLVSFVIIKGKQILALRLREDYNPEILARPAQVWVGELPPAVRDWGNTLANTTTPIPVFVKRQGRKNYTFVGDHEILKRAPTAAELASAKENVPHDRGVSRIVFLKRIETG